ncbi:hypothetical protein ACOSQ3_017337 [Xanthoceras sorbifolium]
MPSCPTSPHIWNLRLLSRSSSPTPLHRLLLHLRPCPPPPSSSSSSASSFIFIFVFVRRLLHLRLCSIPLCCARPLPHPPTTPPLPPPLYIDHTAPFASKFSAEDDVQIYLYSDVLCRSKYFVGESSTPFNCSLHRQILRRGIWLI